MVPSPDDTPESLDGQVTGGGEPDRPVEKSIGEGETAGNDPSTDSPHGSPHGSHKDELSFYLTEGS